MIKYNEMRKMLDLCGYGKGTCSTCMGGNGNCAIWMHEIGASCGCKFEDNRYYANKSECEALLEYWDDKEGPIEEWRENNVPMKKWNADGLKCESCMGDVLDCRPWVKSIGRTWCGERSKAYANKKQTEALLQWHDDRYGSIEQARLDSKKDHSNGDCINFYVDVFNRPPEQMERILNGYLRPKEEPPKPFSDLEEFDLKIIKMFIERRKIKFLQLCLGLGLEREDANRIIAGIK